MKTRKSLDGSSKDVETDRTCQRGLELLILLVDSILGVRRMEEMRVCFILGI